MRVRIAHALLAFVLALFAGGAAAQPAEAPRALVPLEVTDTDYPLAALLAAEQGRVVLNVSVDAAGYVASIEVRTSSGSPRLDQQAMLIAKARWRFQPAVRNGEPVADMIEIPVTWTLPLRPASDSYIAPAAAKGVVRPVLQPGFSAYVSDQGVAGIKYLAGANGRPTATQIAVSSGSPRLDAAALRFVGGAANAPAAETGDWRDITVAFTTIRREGGNAPMRCYTRPILAHESVLVRAEPVVLYRSQMNMAPVMSWRVQPVGQWTAIWVHVSNTGAITDALLDTAKGWMHLSAPLIAEMTKGRHYPQNAGNVCWYYDPVMITG